MKKNWSDESLLANTLKLVKTKKNGGKRKEDLIYCNKLLQNSMCLGCNCQISESYSIRYEKIVNNPHKRWWVYL